MTLNPSALEQYMLELTNSMRIDPQATFNEFIDQVNPIHSPDPKVNSALQFFDVDGPTLQAQWAQLTATAPLAWHEALQDAAATHNQLIIVNDELSHQFPGEAGLGDRITAAGYLNRGLVGENIFHRAQSVYHGHAGFAIDWGGGAGSVNGIQNPPGHRDNIMRSIFREIGISIIEDNSNATEVGPIIVTQDFGTRNNFGNSYLLGVVYNDDDEDAFYSVGEGLGGVLVEIDGTGGQFMTTTMDAGGYQLQIPAGTYTVTFSGVGLVADVVRQVVVGDSNVKLDATNDNATRVTITAGAAAADEAGDPGSFTVTRTGDTTSDLTVELDITGTADNGTDYEEIPDSVVIPGGSASVVVNVNPQQDDTIEGDQTIIATVAAGAGYLIGNPSTATVTMSDDDGRLLAFGGKTKAQYFDANGDTVTVTLGGPGTGQVILPPGNANTLADAIEIIAQRRIFTL